MKTAFVAIVCLVIFSMCPNVSEAGDGFNRGFGFSRNVVINRGFNRDFNRGFSNRGFSNRGFSRNVFINRGFDRGGYSRGFSSRGFRDFGCNRGRGFSFRF